MTNREGARDEHSTFGDKPTPQGGTAHDRSAGVPPAVSGAFRPRFGEIKIRDRGRIPHWEKESATYFVTFRLADSLPKSVLEHIESERESLVKTAKQLQRELSSDERVKIKSAKRANELLNHAGSFWQREYYDHLVRDESEFERAVRYVAENPEKANLGNWPWVWVGGRDAHPTAGGTPALPEPEPRL